MSGIGIISPHWPAPPNVRAAFSLRAGGVSSGAFESLNLGTHVADAPECVAENRRRLLAALSLPEEPAWLDQVHGIDVVDLDRAGAAQRLEGDAAITRSAGRVCAIGVADCMPVLFARRDGAAIGAAHAGWRGLANGVLEATVSAIGREPSELIAWLGPAIGAAHFEVGDEVRRAFVTRDAQAAAAFSRNSRGRWQCDLYSLARLRLERLGLHAITGGGWCTYADPQRFFSFRRDGRCGRMAALIWMENPAS